MRISLRLLSYLKPYWFFHLLYVLCSLLYSISHLALPWLEKILIDNVFGTRNPKMLLPICGLYILTAACMYLFTFGIVYFSTKTTENSARDMQMAAYHHLRRLGFQFYDSQKTGRVMSIFTSDIPRTVEGIRVLAGDYILNIVTLTVTLFILFSINLQLCLFALLLVAVTSVIPVILDKPLKRIAQEFQEEKAQLSSNLQESIAGSRELKGLGKEFYDLTKIQKSLSRILAVSLKQAIIRQAGNVTIVLFWIATALIFLVGGRYVLNGVLTIGEIFAITRYFNHVYRPVNVLISLQNQFPLILVAAKRVFSFLDSYKEESFDGIVVKQIEGRVQFSNVSFGYDTKNNTVLKDISFEASPGEIIALVGPSGAGKSTLVNLIPRFYTHQRGEILVDNMSINAINIQSLRSHIGIVFQDPYLFANTIEYNIRLGAHEPETISHEQVVEAAKLANIYEFIMGLPDQYHTTVGERGIQLSGGQRQRIAIARVLIRNPKILILDEATSALDAKSEYLVQQALIKLMEGRTSFVIAHRLSTILNADKILVLKDGRIVEWGDHEELIGGRGIYYDLFQRQFSRNERCGESI